MNRRTCWLLFFFASGTFFSVSGQFYETGEVPAGMRLKTLNTPHFNIVFPASNEKDALETGLKLEGNFSKTFQDYPLTLRRSYPVLLHTSTVLSNGYVSYAPRRMEIVTTPPQMSYAHDWISQLAQHELRHTAQLNWLNQGVTRVMGIFTGQIAVGAVSSMIPMWLYEGDAVYNETMLSQSGRGRMPAFEMPLRTLLLGKPGIYSYDKAVFGSYRDFVPDHYINGYQMVSFARSAFGDTVWSGAIRHVARHPYQVWPLAFYLKKHFGLYKSGLYQQTMNNLKEQYNKYIDSVNYSNYISIVDRKSGIHTHYTRPHDLGEGKTLVYRNGLADPGSFVVIDTGGNEHRVLQTGFSAEPNCDVYQQWLVWDEWVPDPRRERRDYSVIRKADIGKGNIIALTRKTRYFSPDFSPDGQQIAVAENDANGNNFLTIISAATGETLLRFPSPGNRALQTPEWDGPHRVLAVTLSEQGKQIEMLDLQVGQWRMLLPSTWFDIADPLVYKHFLIFRGAFGGTDNLYALNMNNPEGWYQLTRSRYGAYYPAVSRDSLSLLFSIYMPEGFDVTRISSDTLTWQKIPAPPISKYTKGASSHEGLPDTTANGFTIKPYRKGLHLFNFHSWLPFFVEWDDLTGSSQDIALYPGFTLFSQNLISSVISGIGYEYYDKHHLIHPFIVWREWYPVFELSAVYGGPDHLKPTDLSESGFTNSSATYNQVKLSTYVPLSFSRGNQHLRLLPKLEVEHYSRWYTLDETPRRGYNLVHLQGSIHRYQRYSQRDLFPRWGQYCRFTYTETPFDHGLLGSMFSIEGRAYFPGLFRHHHFYLSTGVQQQYPGMYYIPLNRLSFPRGYSSTVSEFLSTMQLNYAFPAAYPDWSLGPLMYLKRIRCNLFYDWSYASNLERDSGRMTGNLSSFGTEIMTDMHVLRILFPLSTGIRLGYARYDNTFFAEWLFGFNTNIF